MTAKQLHPNRPAMNESPGVLVSGRLRPLFAGVVAMNAVGLESGRDSFAAFHAQQPDRLINAFLALDSPDGGYLLGWADARGVLQPAPDEDGRGPMTVSHFDAPGHTGAAGALRGFLALLLIFMADHRPPSMNLAQYLLD